MELEIYDKRKIFVPLNSLDGAILNVSFQLEHGRFQRIYPVTEVIRRQDMQIRHLVNARKSRSKKYEPGTCAVVKKRKQEAAISYTIRLSLDEVVTDVAIPDNIAALANELVGEEQDEKEKVHKLFDYIKDTIKYGLVPKEVVEDYTRYLQRNKKKNIEDRLRGYFGYLKRKVRHNARKTPRNGEFERIEKQYNAKMAELLEKFLKSGRARKDSKMRTLAKNFLNYAADNYDDFFLNIWDRSKLYDFRHHVNNGGYCKVIAKIFQQLLASQGIQTVYIEGSHGANRHAWLAVKVDGDWKLMDPTNTNTKGRYQTGDDYQLHLSFMPMNAKIKEAFFYPKKEIEAGKKYGMIKPNLQ
ncbi:transglutaminase domain-containing protein [Candidatus Woesearchaeota archaeon]|nr:transglutaminase domain-containing protein [Candidatus Woesearchaeota archaeon]MBW3021391.1 transglutaminase domain-containing protein [Candidatus Woesearchaeota archaeon]